ncbi:hypothetical protein LTR10_010769 [Elasticomyces elasticus]|uniref:Uncharacterized protein n=1 Tax=Elasticomyces elasticus TaxID=574655 RepID=A0AAN7W3H3_9PEZI|nr:hypothetical protein LTR10_010769 [Elasticomyces elasticus]KAK4968375.1 hypothetical protein LTR42_009658 [Elasticomyces elasticus]KAK5696042.1 hypothetical protein LTR97_008462 [Elasticomyces elasticus]KAK5719370.1 hypothetical protein LTR15_007893 [Elasticomyces elasticus]
MALHELISAMRTRDQIKDLREYKSTHTFKITEEEYLNELPLLIDAAELSEFERERLLFEYVALTGRFTIFPSASSIAHEGMVGFVLEEFAQQKGNHRDQLRATGGEPAEIGDLVGTIISAGHGAGDVGVQGYATFPSLVWRGGPEQEVSALLHVIHTDDIAVLDLLKEATEANSSIQYVPYILWSTMIPSPIGHTQLDMRASIHAYQRSTNGVFEQMDTGGEFRDKNGGPKACKLAITVGHLLPTGTSTTETNDLKITVEMTSACQQLTGCEVADAEMCRKFALIPFIPDVSPVEDGSLVARRR